MSGLTLMRNYHINFTNRVLQVASYIGFSCLITSNAHGELTPNATKLTEVFGMPITNSMVTSWVLSAFIILLIRFLVKKPKLVPTGGQLVVENLVEGVKGIIEPIVGKHLVKPTFPLLVGFFTFILLHNWSGLLPGVGTIGFVDDHGHFQSYIRPANADLNMTLALALVHFVAWIYFVMKFAGPKLLIFDLFGNKADKKETPTILFYFLTVVFVFVGFIEVLSIIFRNVSLPFRLFGNVFGGENLLHSMTGLAGWIVPVPFYFLELLVGLVQALVFTILVSVYIGLICNHDDSEEHAH
ncbi:MAG: F0F1 ATP synthase subunit A [Opitutales bacterium]|nr:F0F1 ATP synthase subunit A [Opitutales bacterium]